MLDLPNRYGSSIGAFRPIEEKPITINLRDGGLNTSVAASQLEDGEASNAIDVRFTSGGVNTDYGTSVFGSAYAGAGAKNILHVANFEKDSVTKLLMRLRSTGWDRWNGSNWLTIPGVTGASIVDHYYSTVIQAKFVAAQGTDRLKAWDGVDANAVADLSADAPRAKYITRIGTRILAAVINDGAGNIDYNKVAWCADGLITDWTTVNLGAGSTNPPMEGVNKAANFITGMSTLQRGAVLYRQRSIQLATLTGVGASPFRFTTIDFSHGTESPYSIAAGGAVDGDYYLGYDYMPYLFDGDKAVPIGIPIYDTLRDSISDRSLVVGAVDDNEQEYHLAYPIAGQTYLTYSWVFNIKEYAKTGRLVWRKHTLPANTQAFGYGLLGANTDPLINSVSAIVDTVGIRVNDYANIRGPDRILFGDNNGQVYQTDKTVPVTTGIWESKQFLLDGNEVTVDRFRLKYKAPANASVAISVSTDGGANYQMEKICNLSTTATGDGICFGDFMVTGRSFQFRIRMLSGFCTINQLLLTLQIRGQGNA